MLRFVSLTVLFLTVVSPTTRADIIIDVQDAMITAGGSGWVDVFISSSDGSDTLDFANYDFAISVVGVPASTLQFSNPQDLTETGFFNYVFAGDADAITVVTLNNSQYAAYAGTLLFLGVDLTTSPSTALLARLEVESVLGPGQTAAQANGEQFEISLLSSANTLFQDENGNDLTIDGSSFTNTGLITIQATAAVPEPGSLALCAIGAAVMAYRMRRQRNKTHSSEPIMAGEPGDQMG